ncbi:hypothetical protein JL193_02160 [Polaribacter batillariae]|uniref:DUF6438 domain-containing protein n=1 Tax=Polaribacter batillariae TaxID=2808900 RepID=A0ABX7SV67_9FLAO|nr:DUF6438 domain-containing protein [Polaribacter batillariae]QTD38132.1 hypothetical protein JL193_02160 [Polaribacter batillariae]
MKIYSILIFLFILSCHQAKSVKEKNNEQKPSVGKEVEAVKLKKEILYTNLLVVLKNPEDFNKIKTELKNSNLSIDKIIANNKTYKAVTVKVPADKTSFWIDNFTKTGNFSSVEINTETALKKVNYFSKKRLVSVVKTPCFGDCPVFEVTFFKDGNVYFWGKEYTLVKGFYKFKLKEPLLKKLNNLLKKTTFKNFESAKNSEKLKDYSNTFITYNDEKLMVKVWIDIPDEIAIAYDYIEGILIEKKLIE